MSDDWTFYADAAEQQSVTLTEISEKTQHISTELDEVNKCAQTSTEFAQQLKGNTEKVGSVISQFKL